MVRIKIKWDRMDWISLIKDRHKRRTDVNTVTNVQVP
jgi:hypothetical protein